MRVVRLRRGYRVSLSDAEFEALGIVTSQGFSEMESFGDLTEALGGVYSKEAIEILDGDRFSAAKLLKVDDDRRRS